MISLKGSVVMRACLFASLKHDLVALGIVGIILSLTYAVNQDSFEWELRVNVEKTDIHMEPDENSTIVITIPQSSILRSYQKEGEWFRLILQQEAGVAMVVHIHSSQISIMKEKVEGMTDF